MWENIIHEINLKNVEHYFKGIYAHSNIILYDFQNHFVNYNPNFNIAPLFFVGENE